MPLTLLKYGRLMFLLLPLANSCSLFADQQPVAKSTTKLAPLAPFERYKPEDRGRWAYQTRKRPEVSKVDNTAWVKTPIDPFVLVAWREAV